VRITISATQRDAIYDDVLTHLSGIDGLWLAIEREDFATADRLGREFADDLTLVLDDLGWGAESSSSESIELTTQTDVLRRVLGQLRVRAARHVQTEEEAINERREERSRAQLVVDTCDEVLSALGEGSPV
jgi:hypothetical protein